MTEAMRLASGREEEKKRKQDQKVEKGKDN